MGGEKKNFGLPKLDDLFTTQQERDDAKLKKIEMIPIELIDPFPDHPFQVRDDEDMDNLVESISERGILTPVTLRKKDDGRYEILSGHRRTHAAKRAGLKKIRSEVVEMNRDQAVIFMVDSNLQRTTILPSEKAFSYKMRLDAMNRQGIRSDLTSCPVGTKLKGQRSDKTLAENAPDSTRQIHRYIRLTKLIPELLQLVDEGKNALRPAVEISYIPHELQQELFNEIEANQCTPSLNQASRMRQMHGEGKLSPEVIEAIMGEEKPNQKDRIVIRNEKVEKYFPKNWPVSKREEYIVKALQYYNRHLEKQRNDAR